MWTIHNETPFAAERSWARDRDGAEVWLVAVKGTFLIAPDGSTELAEAQEEVLAAPKYRGEPGRSSLLYESDLVLTKPSTDVLLHGHAYASPARPVVDVAMAVGGIAKRLRVFGDRLWQERALLGGVEKSRPRPFTKMPITYERAFGGTDERAPDPKRHGWEPRNPVGVGFATRAGHLLGQPLPNIEHPDRLIDGWKDRPPPAGFGPIPAAWEPRRASAGTYDTRWRQERYPLLPEDFDERFYHCAPADQRTPRHLLGGETVELRHLTPAGLLRFALPRVALQFTTHFYRGDPVLHRGVLHTVVLEPDVPRVLMVWHTAVPCHHRVSLLRETVVRRKQVLGRGTTPSVLFGAASPRRDLARGVRS